MITRRRFNCLLVTAVGIITGFVSGCASWFGRDTTPTPMLPVSCVQPRDSATYEYIVVGSGAGGGTVAANIARAGHRVLLLEAGGDEEPISYQVPVFHAYASEDPALGWSFFVRHYANDQQQLDSKFSRPDGGILYPRAGTLGGCTAHNAMITIYPHNSDWDYIADLFNDASWKSENMRRYFERLERCEYVDPPPVTDAPTSDDSRHGFRGWLTTTMADPTLILHDRVLLKLVKAAAQQSLDELGGFFTRVLGHVRSRFDPNDWRLVRESQGGVVLVPLSVNGGRRAGAREYIRHVQQSCPQNLIVKTGALVTKIVLDDQNRATGVEYLEGRHLYRADAMAPREGELGMRHQVQASREVILCAGAFNSPQLLKLSGIGPVEELISKGIPVRVPLPGVGENLQDRYEIGVVTEMKKDFSLLRKGPFRPPEPGDPLDPLLEQWRHGRGVYTTNGAILGIMRRSKPTKPDPDLFIFGLAGYFKGYYPTYSQDVARRKNYFTWAILKAHTKNSAGRVRLRTNDPRDTPLIDFHYFDEGNDRTGEDLEAVVEGVQYVRRLNAELSDYIQQEVIPGPTVRTPEDLRTFIKHEAWGHHASCSNKMGLASDNMAVVDNNFRVHGTKNLRVVDASVFPFIPGFFIVTPIYMIAEKASEVILTDTKPASVRNKVPSLKGTEA